MKIGLLTTSFPRADGDVAGAFVLGFARALAARGHTIDVLAPEPATGVAAPRWDGVDVTWVPYLRPRALERTFYGAGVPDNLRRDPTAWLGLAPFSAALALAARRRAHAWDAVVSHWALPSALAASLTGRALPHLAVLHSADVHAIARLPFGGRLAAAVARGASALLFVSPAHRDAFLARLPAPARLDALGRSHVSPMGIELVPSDAAGRRAARAGLGLDRFTVLSLGRLVPIKGIADAIDALRGRDDVELVVAGDGPERARLESHARARRVRARFTGVVDGDRKQALFAGADAFVVPSHVLGSGRSEGVPTSLLEALAAGLPVVASAVGGIPSVVDDERSALLVPPSRPDALAHALDRLRSDAPLRKKLGRAGRTVGQRYAWPILAPRIEALLTAP